MSSSPSSRCASSAAAIAASSSSSEISGYSLTVSPFAGLITAYLLISLQIAGCFDSGPRAQPGSTCDAVSPAESPSTKLRSLVAVAVDICGSPLLLICALFSQLEPGRAWVAVAAGRRLRRCRRRAIAEHQLGRAYSAPDPLGDGRVGDLAAGDVDPELQPGVAARRLGHPEVGEREHVGQGRVGERVGRGDRHRAGHVGDAVVDDPVDLVGRVAVRGRPRGLEAAALVDRDVDQHRVGSHQRELLAGDHVRRARAVDQHARRSPGPCRGSRSSIESVELNTVEARPPKATSSSRSLSIETS